ncbi:uncharacterized protein AB675_10639 [Cyphellophora attinorum]|uniref:Cobalamin-independent methionine synthase MetE C-terminal/archaeal domain-containing protein n=1 Tax=Cyphellophora attinorum TaxID=1664694 RepID=A0A0N0NMW8_9EURO|nr:uncharacterized protein AB675_10639 [Phialophora attinorum]KPI40941.1 hypothetical protein AB675_10639 [Phialophora attinorum]
MTSKLHRGPPFRAEHLGSLLRTEKLLEARHDWEGGKGTEADLKPIEDHDVKEIVKIQQDLNFHALTDGEYRRHMFWGSFWPGLEGMTEVAEPDPAIFRMYIPDIAAFTEAGYKPGETVICTGKIKHKGSTYTDQFDFLKSLVPGDEVKNIKLTLAAPNWYHLRYKQGQAYPSDVYSSDDEYFADIATAYQDELKILYDHGLRNVQFDDPNLAYFCSEAMLEGWQKDKDNIYSADELLQKYIHVYNRAVARFQATCMLVSISVAATSLTPGTSQRVSMFFHVSSDQLTPPLGGYDRIATKLFQELNMHTYYLEYDTPRAGGFEPLQYLPKDKNVILGVITSKFPKMEDEAEMEARVREAVKWMVKGSGETEEEALNRCGVSPQCGFASHSSGNSVTRDDMVAKLKLVRRVADRIWPGQP